MSKKGLLKLIDDWFLSDLDIAFTLRDKKTHEKIPCTFESNVWYEHINNAEGITIKSIRHKGDKRRFIVWKCSDLAYKYLEQFCYTEYDKEQLKDLVETLSEKYYICKDET